MRNAPRNKVRVGTGRALLGTVAHDASRASIGVLVTTSTFTRGAWQSILGDARLGGRDYDGIMNWIAELKGGWFQAEDHVPCGVKRG
jgi:hypothetical protein